MRGNLVQIRDLSGEAIGVQCELNDVERWFQEVVGDALREEQGRLIGENQVPMTIHHEGRVGLAAGEQGFEGSDDGAHGWRVEIEFAECWRISSRHQQIVLFPQRHLEMSREVQHEFATGSRPAGLDVGQVSSRYVRLRRQVELAQVPAGPPLSEERTDPRNALVHRHAEHRTDDRCGRSMTSEVMASMTCRWLSDVMTHAITPQTPHDSTTSAVDQTTVGDIVAVDCERKLRLVLRANAASSTISGLAMAVAPETIDRLLGTGQPGWVRVVGLALLPFAAFVAWLSTTDVRHLRQHTPGIIAGDVGWVAASVVTVLLGWYSGAGIAAVLAMALVVDVFALLQFNAVRHLRRG